MTPGDAPAAATPVGPQPEPGCAYCDDAGWDRFVLPNGMPDIDICPCCRNPVGLRCPYPDGPNQALPRMAP